MFDAFRGLAVVTAADTCSRYDGRNVYSVTMCFFNIQVAQLVCYLICELFYNLLTLFVVTINWCQSLVIHLVYQSVVRLLLSYYYRGY